jgi:hypothetical protein
LIDLHLQSWLLDPLCHQLLDMSPSSWFSKSYISHTCQVVLDSFCRQPLRSSTLRLQLHALWPNVILDSTKHTLATYAKLSSIPFVINLWWHFDLHIETYFSKNTHTRLYL